MVVNKEDFVKQYAEKSGVSIEWLKEHGQVAIECNCEYEKCNGWIMVYDKNNTKK